MLTARMLNSVTDVNHWEIADSIEWVDGTQLYVYFQLVDPTVDRATQGYSPAGRRYMPAVSATLQATIKSVDDAKTYIKTAVQPFSQDPSIWRIQILPTDNCAGSKDLVFALTESGIVTTGRISNALSVHGQGESF